MKVYNLAKLSYSLTMESTEIFKKKTKCKIHNKRNTA